MQLVLNKYGATIKVKNNMFCVGYEKETTDVPVSKVSSILINKSVKLSSNVLFLAIENEIEVILMNKMGQPQGRIWSPKYGSISNIRKNQVAFTKTTEAVVWIKTIIIRKVQNQQSLMYSLQTYDGSNKNLIADYVKKLDALILKIESLNGKSINSIAKNLRGFEGRASKNYFSIINTHIPELYKFQKRSQHPALDMYNALLNYAYGMLYNHVERALIIAGIDPYIGIFHRDNYNRPVLVYDFIEQYRIWADFVVLDLCMQNVMFPEFFDVNNEVWLLNENGKRILITSFNDYMEEIIDFNGNSRSRVHHIELDAQKFATQLKNLKISTNIIVN